jgi:hypothetical protein
MPGMGLGAYPSANPRFRVVSSHSQSSEGERSPVRGNADCCHSPNRDGRAVCHAPGGSAFHRGVCARALTH